MKKVIPSTLLGRFFYHLSLFRFHLIVALLIILIGLVTFTFFAYVTHLSPELMTHEYLVAGEDLPAGSEVEESKLAKVSFVEGYTPKNAIPAENLQKVVGKYTLFPMSRGDVINAWYLGETPEGSPMELSSQIDISKKLLYLRKGDIQTPPASLSLYDRLDFYTSSEATASAVLENIQVVDIAKSDNEDLVIGIAVTDQEVRELVALLAKKSYIQVVVVPKPKNETSKLTK